MLLLIGALPIALFFLSTGIAHLLGCYFGEFEIYSRSGTYGDFSDDAIGCKAGGMELGPILERVHLYAFVGLATSPLLILSLGLWAVIIVRRLRAGR